MEKFEGALGKGKGRKLYAYKVMMAKVTFHDHNIISRMFVALISYNLIC